MNEIVGTPVGNGTVAPSPYTSRGALSEAWYRALYASQPPSSSTSQTARARGGADPTPVTNERAPDGRPRARGEDRVPALRPFVQRPAPAVVAIRRGRTEPVVRSTTAAARSWRTALAHRLLVRCSLRAGASVEVLVQQRGRRLNVVALADSAPAATDIAAALHRVRVVLAAHGLALDSDVREKGFA